MIASGGAFKQVGLIRHRFSIDLMTAKTNHAFVCIKVAFVTHTILEFEIHQILWKLFFLQA